MISRTDCRHIRLRDALMDLARKAKRSGHAPKLVHQLLTDARAAHRKAMRKQAGTRTPTEADALIRTAMAIEARQRREVSAWWASFPQEASR